MFARGCAIGGKSVGSGWWLWWVGLGWGAEGRGGGRPSGLLKPDRHLPPDLPLQSRPSACLAARDLLP